jgi:hypothetical protein
MVRAGTMTPPETAIILEPYGFQVSAAGDSLRAMATIPFHSLFSSGKNPVYYDASQWVRQAELQALTVPVQPGTVRNPFTQRVSGGVNTAFLDQVEGTWFR